MTWEYIAGFFDGEGSLTNNGKGYRVTISQTNYEVLDSIKKHSGVGSVLQNKKRQIHWKESWIYYIAKQNDVYFFLKKILPFTVVKAEKIESELSHIKNIAERIEDNKLIRKSKINTAKKLRKQGLTYRKIGERMSVDFGYARRLVLNNN